MKTLCFLLNLMSSDNVIIFKRVATLYSYTIELATIAIELKYI